MHSKGDNTDFLIYDKADAIIDIIENLWMTS